MLKIDKSALLFWLFKLRIKFLGGEFTQPKDFPKEFFLIKFKNGEDEIFSRKLLKVILQGNFGKINFNEKEETILVGKDSNDYTMLISYTGEIIQTALKTGILGNPIIQQHIEPIGDGVYKLISKNFLANLHWELLFNTKGEKLSDYKYFYP